MQRIGFLIRVREDKLDEYIKRHQPIWPELAAEIKKAGLRNYTLWLAPGGLEFGYVECDDWKAACEYLDKSEVHARWQKEMQEFLATPMDPALGGQPVQMLRQVFFLE